MASYEELLEIVLEKEGGARGKYLDQVSKELESLYDEYHNTPFNDVEKRNKLDSEIEKVKSKIHKYSSFGSGLDRGLNAKHGYSADRKDKNYKNSYMRNRERYITDGINQIRGAEPKLSSFNRGEAEDEIETSQDSKKRFKEDFGGPVKPKSETTKKLDSKLKRVKESVDDMKLEIYESWHSGEISLEERDLLLQNF